MGSGPEERFGRERLGGPPGLYDAPNRDRESTGGIVQRMRVPASTAREEMFQGLPFGQELQDSDTLREQEGAAPERDQKPTREALECGVPYKKSITGDQC